MEEENKKMEKEELKKQMQEYADSKGYKLNPDEKMLDMVLAGLLKNKEMKGEIYCPCRVNQGDKEKDKVNICPCVFHPGEIIQDGHCKCRLFFRGDEE